MEQWVLGQSEGGLVGCLLVCLVIILVLVAPGWIALIVVWRDSRDLRVKLMEREKSHTQDLLMQSERFAQQYYSQGERSSLVLSDSLRRVTDSFAKAVSGMPED